MGYRVTGGSARSLTELIDQMADEMERKLSREVQDAQPRELAPDFTSLRDPRTQAALLSVIEELGRVTQSDLQARTAHLPELAARVPRFLEYSRGQDWIRVVDCNDQGHVFSLTDGGRVHKEKHGPTDLPPGSTPLTP